ncbi:MAG: hypothetical protein ACF8NJ_03385 [Phycisphaerales bacterium JB038]
MSKHLLQTGIFIAALLLAASAIAESNIDSDHKFSWGENIGWMNWRDANNGTDGAVIGGNYFWGHIWCENVGWICLGDGSPADGLKYSNTDGSDYGVNMDFDTGELSGYAWGENIGWVNFSTTGALGADGARFDIPDSRLRGYAWAENVGWINLDDSEHYVASLVLPTDCDGDLDGDGDTDQADLGVLLASYNTDAGGDLDGDGDTDQADLGILLADYGCAP